MRAASTRQTWKSGTSVSARRPLRSPPSSTTVPVSAIASAQPVSTPSTWSSPRAEIGGSSTSSSRPATWYGAPGGTASRRAPCSRHAAATASSTSAAEIAPDGGPVVARALAEARDDRLAAGRRAARRRRGSRAGPPARPAGAERAADPAEDLLARARHAGGPPCDRPAVSARGAAGAARAGGRSAHHSRNDCAGRPAARASPSSPTCRAGGGRAARCRPGEPLRALVAPARPEHLRERVHRQPLGAPARLDLVHDPPAQVDEHGRDVDLDRADLVAGAAQRGRPRQRRRLVEPLELRREDRADRARVDRLVGVAAGARVDRADVQAGRAADAVQRLAADLVREHVGPARVEQDEVELARAVVLAHARPDRRVRVHPLRGRGARQQLEHHLEVAPGRQHLLDPHQRDQDLRQRRAHAAVALGLDDADRARLGDREVRAARPRPGRVRNFSRRCRRAASAIARRLEPELLARGDRALEQRGDLGPVAVDRGDEDVRLLVVAELDDQLGEVGLDRVDPAEGERLVEPDLVGRQRLDLDDLVAPRCRARSAATIAFASAPSRAQWTVPPARA